MPRTEAEIQEMVTFVAQALRDLEDARTGNQTLSPKRLDQCHEVEQILLAAQQ